MTEKYSYRLEIITVATQEELPEVARQVAEILPCSQWIKGTANILLENPDFYAIKTAVKLAGGEDFDIEALVDIPQTQTATISVNEDLIFDSAQYRRENHLLMLNEFPLLLRGDDWVDELLQVPGVPNTTYRVDGGRVFVFAVFEEQIREILRANPYAAISEVGLIALPSAWISATDAVEQFNIVPVPYKRSEIEGKLAIVHESFNAVLPPRFDTESDRNAALAQLLLGKVLPGSGEFEFRGQLMTMLEPLNLNLLPPTPFVNILEAENEGLTYYQAATDYSCLGNTDYIPGFPLLDLQAFSAIRAAEISWRAARMEIICLVCNEISCIWQKITHPSLDWKLLNIDYDIPNSELQNLHKLRNAYPELAELSDQALYWSFASYQVDCYGELDWSVLDCSPSKEGSFIFYLLGLLCIGGQANKKDAEKVGIFVAYQLLHNTESEILEQGKIMFNYHAALHSLARRTRRIIDFLQSTPNQGELLSTLSIFLTRSNQSAFRLPNY